MAMVNDEGVGETQGEQQQARRVVEPDLLWIESVTERLLGSASRPHSAWESVYFDERVGVEAATPAYQPPTPPAEPDARDEHAESSESAAPTAPVNNEAAAADYAIESATGGAGVPVAVADSASETASDAAPEVSVAATDDVVSAPELPAVAETSDSQPATVVDLTSDVPAIVTGPATSAVQPSTDEQTVPTSTVEEPAPQAATAVAEPVATPLAVAPVSPVPYFESPRPAPVAESYSVEDYAVRGYVPPLRLSPQPATVSQPVDQPVLPIVEPDVPEPTAAATAAAVPEVPASPPPPDAPPTAPPVAPPVPAAPGGTTVSAPIAEPITTLPAAPRPHRRPEPPIGQPVGVAALTAEGARPAAPSGSVPWDDTPAWHATAQSAAAAAAAAPSAPPAAAQLAPEPVVVEPPPPAPAPPAAPAERAAAVPVEAPVAASVEVPAAGPDDGAESSARHSRSKHGTTVDAGETALRLAFLSGDAKLAEAVVRLLTDRSADQQRLGMVESYLDALLDEGGEALPGAARLRRLLRE